MAIRKISEFVSAVPTSEDKILFEHNGSGKSCSIGKVVGVLGRTRRDITNDLTNLTTAISEQNLEKYGYKIGDYFIGPSGYQYNLADMDTYYGGYNLSAVVSVHHCGILVDTDSSCQWSSSGVATSYSASTLHSFLKGTVLNNIKSDMIALFGGTTGLEHLIANKLIDNAIGNWGTVWDGLSDTYISALSEVQVYGTNVFSTDAYQTGTSCKQLKIFSEYRFNEILGVTWLWLRSLVSTTLGCISSNEGIALYTELSNAGRACGLILFY